jgi:hypothetical protein
MYFDYIIIAGRKLTQLEYNKELVAIWPWSIIIYFGCSLKGVDK